MKTTERHYSSISDHAYRITVIARGMKVEDSITTRYRRNAEPVLRRLAGEVISGDYCRPAAAVTA